MLDAAPPHSSDTTEPPQLLTVEQAADMLGLTTRTIYRLQAEGVLTPVYLATTGRRLRRRFRRSDIEARVAAAQQVSA